LLDLAVAQAMRSTIHSGEQLGMQRTPGGPASARRDLLSPPVWR
jgi:hypothetical protein